MSRWLPAAAVLGAVLALVLAFVTQQVTSLGEVPFGWMIATAVVWLLALLLSVAGLITSRARSGAAWLGIAVSAVLPLAVTFLVTHPASGA